LLDRILDDADWLTIINALQVNRSPKTQDLAKRLMQKTKVGRQIRLLRMLRDKQPSMTDLVRILKTSRRTVFRDLLALEKSGVKIVCDRQNRYHVLEIPTRFEKML
jgi:predicted DNA-binding transcriptional regulator YafY